MGEPRQGDPSVIPKFEAARAAVQRVILRFSSQRAPGSWRYGAWITRARHFARLVLGLRP